MAGETILNIVGNLTSDPEMRYTQNGLAVANFTVASTPRTFDRAKNEWVDGEALFIRCSVWREYAEHVAASLIKGSRVMVSGRFRQRAYETKEGEKRTSFELEVDEIGPSLRYATAQLTRTSSSRNNTAGGQPTYSSPEAAAAANRGGQAPAGEPWGQPAGQAQDVWNTPPGGGTYNDETPF